MLDVRGEYVVMNTKYDDWRDDAARWLSAMDEALVNQTGDDVVIPYEQVALAFPSQRPNPKSFDYPLIEHEQLVAWASARNWQVRPATEMSVPDEIGYLPVRFTRLR